MIVPVFDCLTAFDDVGLPPQDISALTFCQSAKLAKVREFAESLRLTQTHATGAALYTAVPELARLKVDAKTRFEMLEAMWPAVQHLSSALARDCLTQTGALTESQRKGLIVAQALQKHLADGYAVVARDLVITPKPKPAQQEMLINAAYRGLCAAAVLMLRNYQLYAQVPVGVWRRVHTLWRALRELELDRRHTTLATTDKLRSPLDQYLRLLCLAAASPNQLTQNEVSATFEALGEWAGSARLVEARQQHIFRIDLNSDRGPQLASRAADKKDHLALDMTQLAAGISANERAQVELLNSPTRLSVPGDISAPLLRQLLMAWTQTRERDHERRRVDIVMDVAVGLIDAHYYLCDGESFEQYIREHEVPQDGPGVSEGFSDLINKLSKPKPVGTKIRQNLFTLSMQNISDGGCLLFWEGALPNRIEAGELLALREDGRPRWQVGVVRWVRKLKTGSELGVRLLGDEMTPYGAAAAFDLGGFSDYTRALHLPHPFLTEAPAALLTPAVPFQENMRVRIKRDGRVRDVRLTRCLLATGKVKVFAFESLNPEKT